jgi:hypothetical protein
MKEIRDRISQNRIMCKKSGCKFKRSKENEYCNKHQLCLFENETALLEKKLCPNYIRGCRAQLELSYPYSRCPDCLENDRTYDHERREKAQEKYVELSSNSKTQTCTACCIEYDVSEFMGVNDKKTKTCSSCRRQNYVQDQRRDKEHRNYVSRINRNNAFHSYTKEAARRNYAFELSQEEFNALIDDPCYYCGEIDQEKQFNGVDRIDSALGYHPTNCVSCCTLCNYIKHTTPIDAFFERIEHILTHLGLVEGRFFPNAFRDFISGNYTGFKRSAAARNIVFEITSDQFSQITRQSCYICGKENSHIHQNGIDRFDNTIGYIEQNCKSCCNTCNMMKNRFEYDRIISKFQQIYIHKIRG